MTEASQRSLQLNRRTLLGSAAVAALGAAGIGGFLFTESVIGPWRLTARRLVDRLQDTAGGTFPGCRRNHAKGVAVAGYFDSNGNGVELSKASVFRPGRYRLDGRFSLAGGNPHMPDVPAAPRGLGLRLFLPGGEQWRMAMINVPVFLDATAQDFYDRTLAFAPDPATGKPDTAVMSRYIAAHPKTAAALSIIEQGAPPATFAETAFFGLNAFEFANADGDAVPVRWRLVPDNPAPLAQPVGENALFDGLVAGIQAAPLRWKLVVTVGERGVDPTDDATKAWPPGRREVQVGAVVVEQAHTESADNVQNVNFDPLVLPDGIAPSDDPLLQARSAAYAESYRRRAGETKPTGAVVVKEV
ncbi:catalase family peroxidase [Nocardia sp. NBC_00508]|uniref:catalase family peroxidase n=1 Tax=Nocardia sp. NBC_00508 TaxID=2975992 RepID=UPI002E813C73|nr:catalase family peroxidase [Nocardia sp. NBC_00508]WUD69200.1 catalase family peroxidase [Nocardia sp. NBC_00508]